MDLITKDTLHTYISDLEDTVNVLEDTGGSGVNVTALEDRVEVLEITATYHAHRLTTAEQYVGVSRGYTDYHQGRAIHMADSRIH